MINARVLLDGSNIILNSAANEILNRSGSAELFANATSNTTFSYGDVNANVELNGEVNCKRRVKASGIDFKCKYLQVNFEHYFGREKESGSKWAKNVMSVGIEQPILSD
jgi:type IV pilus assembly protein PilX